MGFWATVNGARCAPYQTKDNILQKVLFNHQNVLFCSVSHVGQPLPYRAPSTNRKKFLLGGVTHPAAAPTQPEGSVGGSVDNPQPFYI
jgi:hypothetical protein